MVTLHGHVRERVIWSRYRENVTWSHHIVTSHIHLTERMSHYVTENVIERMSHGHVTERGPHVHVTEKRSHSHVIWSCHRENVTWLQKEHHATSQTVCDILLQLQLERRVVTSQTECCHIIERS